MGKVFSVVFSRRVTESSEQAMGGNGSGLRSPQITMTERQRKFGLVTCCALMLTLGLFSQCGLYAQPPAKVDQVKLREQLRSLIKEQNQLLEGVQKRLVESVNTSSALFDQLSAAQTQVNKIGEERDGWKAYGEDQHEKYINAEKRVAEQKVAKLKWMGAFFGLLTLVIAYFGLKFLTPLGKFIP